MTGPPGDLFRALFDKSSVPAWLYDPRARRVLVANDAALRVSRTPPGELVALEPDAFGERVRAELREARAAEPARGADGMSAGGELVTVAVPHEDGELMLAFFADTGDRSSVEAERKQSQKFEAIGRLAGGVAHDFNNILTAVLGFSDLVLSRLPEGDPLRKPVGEIRKAGERAAALTRQLLAFSQRQMMAPQTVDLNTLLAGVVPMLRRVIGEKVKITLSPAPEAAVVLVDPGLIEQCVYELALNGKDAMPEGGVLSLRVAVRELGEEEAARRFPMIPGRYVVLGVEDSGRGIEPELQKRLFEPFFTTKPRGQATGMGLATVYGTVKQSGGFVFVASEPGKGTRVEIHLPAPAGQVLTPSNPLRRLGPRRSASILVVEDEEQVRALLTAILTEEGHRVLTAVDGAEAVTILRNPGTLVELLLTDVVMPRMDGPEVAEAAREQRPGLPVLFMSGYADSPKVRESILDRGLPFLQKPFTRSRLLQKVHELLAK